MLQNIIFLVTGWFLGLLSHLIIDSIKKYQEKKELKSGIINELEEFRFRIVVIVNQFSIKSGTYNKELVSWLYQQMKSYKGTYPKEEFIKKLENFLKYDNQQLINSIKEIQMQERTPILMPYNLPFLDSKLNEVYKLDLQFQSKIYEIKNQIQILNHITETIKFFFNKTFDSNLSDKNRALVKNNLTSFYKQTAEVAKLLAHKIYDITVGESKDEIN